MRLSVFFIVTLFSLSAVPSAHAFDRLEYDDILYQLKRDAHLTVRSMPIDLETIPRGAQRVPMLRLKLWNSCDSDKLARIWSMKVRKVGLGDASFIRGVYLMEGNQRLSRPTRISGDDNIAELRTFRLAIKPCEQRIIDIAADFSVGTPSGSEYLFRLEKASDILTSATSVKGLFPLVNATRPSITPKPAGTVNVEFLEVGRIKVLQNEVLAKFSVTADGTSHYLVYDVLLTNGGSAKDDDIRNLYITRNNGRPLSRIQTKMDGKQVYFKFERPIFLRRNGSLTFELRGKPFTSRETVSFELEDPSDMKFIPSRRGGRTLE